MESSIMEKCAMTLEQNAKGSWQGKVAVESGSVERSKELLCDSITALKEVASEKGLALAGAYY